MRSLTFRVPGKVASQGSKIPGVSKAGKPFMREADKGLPVWRDSLITAAKVAALQHEAKAGEPWDGDEPGLQVEVAFAIERPKGHYRGGDPSRGLKPSAPLYCANTPDVDKASRAVLDALQQADVIRDDRRVVRLVATTLYAGPQVGDPGATVCVTPFALRPGRDNDATLP